MPVGASNHTEPFDRQKCIASVVQTKPVTFGCHALCNMKAVQAIMQHNLLEMLVTPACTPLPVETKTHF